MLGVLFLRKEQFHILLRFYDVLHLIPRLAVLRVECFFLGEQSRILCIQVFHFGQLFQAGFIESGFRRLMQCNLLPVRFQKFGTVPGFAVSIVYRPGLGIVDDVRTEDCNLGHADISATTLSEVAGVACYKVEFTSGEYAYAYTINAETGAVMEMSSQEQNAQASGTQTETTDPAAPAPAQNATGTGTVDEAAAQKIALEHAGVKAADATITKSKLDYEDGHQVYDIEWYAGGAKYDYEIATDTGEIISSAYEEKTMGTDSKNVTVSEADAKKTALDRVSGATDKDLYEWKLDYDDGRPEYEGKIIYGGTEYEFTIDAATGSVTEWDAEKVR